MKVRCKDIIVGGDRFRKVDSGSISQLSESIAISGLLQPIIISSDNKLIDGNHRLTAVKSLGWTHIDCIIKDISDLEQDLIQIDTNLCRNDLNSLEQSIHIQKRVEILDLLNGRVKKGYNQHNGRVSHDETPKTAKQLSSEMGISRGDYYRKLKLANDLTKLTKDRLIDSVFGESTTALVTLGKEDKEIQNLVSDRLQKKYNGKKISNIDKIMRTEISQVKNSIEKTKIINTLQGYKDTSLDNRCKIFNDDFRNVSKNISNESIDFIFTDPPYTRETIHLYEDLARFASDKLKDGSFCMAYCSVQILQQVLHLMSKHLTYHHTICVSYRKGSSRSGQWFNEWKPIVMFYKGTKPKHPQISDKITSPDVDQYNKSLHRWAQPLHEPLYFIDKLTNIDDLICDPFLGTGTTGIASLQLGQTFLGVEIDPQTFHIAESRLKKEWHTLSKKK